ncbi:hypothetical protein GCM10009837_80220 [Streptomyces durmitorensis]|uniref:DUF4232 domain-containing protein n=1 Tax=Streptomyces durmitorensis TaxID=319947 RepID=A0ABY4PT74_9ACTN|nr:DUF4232 domain-containing protein [Streptomyces durmitorensis]UQT56181.1 DUF4232 domain-containing protein [Streptomyces durmitorensis]
MRTTRIRTTVLAATTAALALTLTACGGSDGSGGSASKAGSGRSVATADGAKGSEKASGTTVTTETGGGGEQGTTGSGAGKAAPARAAAAQPCTGDEISYAVLHRFPAQEGEHLLITATNADSKPCWVTSYPSVMLGDTSDVLPHAAKDAPGGTARITVKPGGKVYSAVALFTDSDRTHTATELSVALRDQTGDTGPGAGTGAFDGKGAPSEFTWSDAEVTNWNTTKPYDF